MPTFQCRIHSCLPPLLSACISLPATLSRLVCTHTTTLIILIAFWRVSAACVAFDKCRERYTCTSCMHQSASTHRTCSRIVHTRPSATSNSFQSYNCVPMTLNVFLFAVGYASWCTGNLPSHDKTAPNSKGCSCEVGHQRSPKDTALTEYQRECYEMFTAQVSLSETSTWRSYGHHGFQPLWQTALN